MIHKFIDDALNVQVNIKAYIWEHHYMPLIVSIYEQN